MSDAPAEVMPATPGRAAHDPDLPASLRESLRGGWVPPAGPEPAEEEVAGYAAKRREQLSAAFPGRPVVVPAGVAKPRSGDTDYPFRADSDHVWLTGNTNPECVLVLLPEGSGHRATLYVRPRSDRTSLAFFTDRRYGEIWVGPQPGPAELAAALGIATASRAELPAVLEAFSGAVSLRGRDPEVDALVAPGPDDDRLAVALAELRLIKDDWEIAQLEAATAATALGFADCVRELAAARAKGERWLEGTFTRRARTDGGDVGYGSIVAAGAHATTLHWTRNDGPVRDGDLLLLDMGVETPTLYSADVTRTLPVGGRFTGTQRQVYDAVWRAQRAGIAACRPGAAFRDPHRAAMAVLAGALHEWGILPVPPEQSLSEDHAAPGAGLHQRYTLHGTSHMLGLDVHDCASARAETYRNGRLAPGMVFTVEPGLYFQADDLTVPAELRGIGVRIEDDVLVTADGARVLSAQVPTEAEAVERWMADLS